jgi:hypothetical protein
MAEQPRNRRRQIVVNKALQSRVIFATAWAPGLCLACTALLLGVFCMRLYNEAIDADVELPSVVPVFLTAASFMVISTAYMLFNALRFSHRIAGPMYNITQTLTRFRENGPRRRVALRKYDYLGDLQAPLNEFLDWVDEQLPANKEATADAEAPEPVAADAGPR